MTTIAKLQDLHDAFPEGMERLYRLELDHWEEPEDAPAASAPSAPSGFARYAQGAAPLPEVATTNICDCGLSAYGQHASWCSSTKSIDVAGKSEKGRWQKVILISECEGRTLEDIANEVIHFIGAPGEKWRVRILYWKGQMHHDYYHTEIKRGEIVEEADPIIIDTRPNR